AMAAGLTVERDKLAVLEEFLHEALAASVGQARDREGLDIDGALTPAGVTDELLDIIAREGPYGPGNPSARFAFPAANVKFAKVVGENHVRCVLQSADGTKLEGIAFRAANEPLGELLLNAGGLPLHVAGSVKRSSFGGRERIEVHIEDAADPRRQGWAEGCGAMAFTGGGPLLARAGKRPYTDGPAGPFVYRLGREIFNLERRVRLPQGPPVFARNALQPVSICPVYPEGEHARAGGACG